MLMYFYSASNFADGVISLVRQTKLKLKGHIQELVCRWRMEHQAKPTLATNCASFQLESLKNEDSVGRVLESI